MHVRACVLCRESEGEGVREGLGIKFYPKKKLVWETSEAGL